jgi:hypothetical protein
VLHPIRVIVSREYQFEFFMVRAALEVTLREVPGIMTRTHVKLNRVAVAGRYLILEAVTSYVIARSRPVQGVS